MYFETLARASYTSEHETVNRLLNFPKRAFGQAVMKNADLEVMEKTFPTSKAKTNGNEIETG